MPNRKDYDRLINSKWNKAKLKRPSPEKAIRGARAIYRKAMKKPWKGRVELTSGNRYTWIRNGVMYVNPNHPHQPGWEGITHDLSHYCNHRLRPNDRPHSDAQAILEAELTRFVLSPAFEKYRD